MANAIQVREIGGPEVLLWEPSDPGPPGPGQASVRLAAAGLNFIDVYFRTGLYPRPLPFVSGLEGAGEIEALGPDPGDWEVGDRVAWTSVPGSCAQRLLVPTRMLVRVPEGVDLETAAACMLQGMTAHYLTHAVRETRAGDIALVHAAAGGVGLLLIQMLAQAGVVVIGTCSSEEKARLARGAGAAHVIRYDQGEFAPEVRRLSDGLGCHVVYDSVGQSTIEGSLASLRPRGMLALYGQSSGPVPPFDPARLTLGSLFLTRPSLAHYSQDRAELELRADAVLGAIAKGTLDVRIGARFPLEHAADAHRALEGRQTTGKVLLVP